MFPLQFEFMFWISLDSIGQSKSLMHHAKNFMFSIKQSVNNIYRETHSL